MQRWVSAIWRLPTAAASRSLIATHVIPLLASVCPKPGTVTMVCVRLPSSNYHASQAGQEGHTARRSVCRTGRWSSCEGALGSVKKCWVCQARGLPRLMAESFLWFRYSDCKFFLHNLGPLSVHQFAIEKIAACAFFVRARG